MLNAYQAPVLSKIDQELFDDLVPRDHYLRRAVARIDFLAFREIVAVAYSRDTGRPSEDPVLMIKLEFIQYHDNLSDRQVIEKAKTELAYRWFLELGRRDSLPDPSLLAKFRARLGAELHKQVFQEIVGQARDHGLVKDRLRIKDTTHLIADIDVPGALSLVAHVRNRLLAAASHFDHERVEGEWARAEAIRQSTDSANEKSRLTARVTHLSEILEWTSELPAPDGMQNHSRWKQLVNARDVAAKVVCQANDPKASGRTLSAVDPDARRGKHGQWYDGYSTDVMMDGDSELITAINVFAAGGDEALDTLELLDQEQESHGNEIGILSIDGAGFNGPMLRNLEERKISVIVPPPVERATGRFTPNDFQEDHEDGTAICPAGQKSKYRQRDNNRHTTVYRFDSATCEECPLLKQCMKSPPTNTFGRTIRKNDYQPEYDRARAKVTSKEYVQIRQEHPKVERKLAELICRHGGRRARYRGRERVWIQQILTCIAVNVKRIIKLMDAANPTAVFA